MIIDRQEVEKMKINNLNRNPKSKKTFKVEILQLLHQEQKDKKKLMSL